MSEKILVPIDFTDLSEKVIEQASLISARSGLQMVLLHVVKSDNEKEEARMKMEEFVANHSSPEVSASEILVRAGSIFNEIPGEAKDSAYKMMIIGTHGIKGLKQKLIGADIIKLVAKSATPCLVIQKDYPVKHEFKKIILPVASHEGYGKLVGSACFLASAFSAEVHLFSIEKPGYEWPDSIKSNIHIARQKIEKHNLVLKRIKEKQTVLSVGYARQTLQYSKQENADLIAVMAVSSDEYHYFANQDKEELVNNDQGIPVLFASDKEQY